jgi:hypothetical protein
MPESAPTNGSAASYCNSGSSEASLLPDLLDLVNSGLARSTTETRRREGQPGFRATTVRVDSQTDRLFSFGPMVAKLPTCQNRRKSSSTAALVEAHARR